MTTATTPTPTTTPTRHPLYQEPWPDSEYRFFQLGFLVEDLIGTAGRWAEVFGVGPFHVLPRMNTPCMYRGAQTRIELQVAVAQAGPVQIELIEQFCDAPSIYRDFFAEGASGLHQICTLTRDYDGKRAHYERQGYPLVSEMGHGAQRIGYYDTFADFGFVTEVVEYAPSFVDHVAAIAKTCAAWDGTDPVRLLTRDGYRPPEER